MKIAVLREIEPGEGRVGATPDTVKRFVGLGATVSVETGAGIESRIPDGDYEAAGASIAPTAARPPRCRRRAEGAPPERGRTQGIQARRAGDRDDGPARPWRCRQGDGGTPA